MRERKEVNNIYICRHSTNDMRAKFSPTSESLTALEMRSGYKSEV